MPKRVRRVRTAGPKIPDGAVYVASPTMWANPWRCNAMTKKLFVYEMIPQVLQDNFRTWLKGDLEVRFPKGFFPIYDELRPRRERLLRKLHKLRGRDLACWCRLDTPCHADVLLELANDDSFLEVCLLEFRDATNEVTSELRTTAGSPSLCSHGTGQDVARI